MTTYPSTVSEDRSKAHSRQTEELKQHGSNLKEDVKVLKDDLASAASSAKHFVENEAECVAELAKSGGDKAQEVHAMMCRNVKRHPTTAVLTTLGVGILLGRLFAGR